MHTFYTFSGKAKNEPLNECFFVNKKNRVRRLSFLLVGAVGLEPTLVRTRPLNVRVCHSATPPRDFLCALISYNMMVFLSSVKKQFFVFLLASAELFANKK